MVVNDRTCWEGRVTVPTYDRNKFPDNSRFDYFFTRIRRKRNNKEWGIGKSFFILVQNKSIEEKFIELSDKWKNETKGFSQAASKINNTNYLTIIGLGIIYPEKVTKLILMDLQIQSSYWHYALKKITQQNPIPKGLGTNIEKARQYWLEWAKTNHKL